MHTFKDKGDSIGMVTNNDLFFLYNMRKKERERESLSTYNILYLGLYGTKPKNQEDEWLLQDPISLDWSEGWDYLVDYP